MKTTPQTGLKATPCSFYCAPGTRAAAMAHAAALRANVVRAERRAAWLLPLALGLALLASAVGCAPKATLAAITEARNERPTPAHR